MSRSKIMDAYWIEFLEYWHGNVSVNTLDGGNAKHVIGFTINDHAIPTLDEAFWCWYVINILDTNVKLK